MGPLSLPLSEGHHYILTLFDYVTGFPEAVPFKEIDSIFVSEAFFSVFARVAILHELSSYQSMQLTSQLMSNLHKLTEVKPSFTIPFYPSTNGHVLICVLVNSAFPFLYSTFITFISDFIIIITPPFLPFLSCLHIL